ncbi:MAG: MerR family transcriptional regulator [Candidatus Nanopelagicales bacterium]
MNEYAIDEVVRMSGVSSRTLRHYEAVGLLVPSRAGPGGRRYYGAAELRRLQRILVLRELGVGLPRIRAVLDAELDELAALRAHRDQVADEAARLGVLVSALDKTIAALEGRDDMSAEDLFVGLPGYDPDRQRRYEAEIADRYGQDAVDVSKRQVAGMARSDAAAVVEGFADVEQRIAERMRDGVPADDARVLDVLDEHIAVVRRFWSPDAASYAGLGDMYAEHPEFRARYEAVASGLSQFLRDGMQAYAEQRLV